MKDPTNLHIPQETMPQSAPEETQPHGVPQTVGHDISENPTGTIAAPMNYRPSTRQGGSGGSGDFTPDLGSMAGRYGILRALAKGGMGMVSVAKDTELDREVALKEIQPRFRLDNATLHRFMLEARVTGRLEHPGVVPVYGLGAYEDGRPYYAMRFITGRSFGDAIDEFHEADKPGRDTQERTFALRQLLRRFVDVCNTIGYAHSKGILHRDIKPANVMLGAYGETLVVDWGLAKEMVDNKVSAAEPLDTSGDTLTHIPVGDNEETREGFTYMGQTMGTPAYMSPEQAAGKWDVTGVGSDVYSLGAMLYVLLSGTPPYSGPSYEVITRVQKGDYKPVKLVKGSTPSPLDAIVRKAMAFEIKDRYPNALALANDVDKWLADEPVSCYREPFLVRAHRWTRRHRTAVITAGVVTLTGTLALAVGLVAVNAERKRTEIQKQNAIDSRDKEREALLTLTDDAIGEMLAGTAKLTPQQTRYLDGLLGTYQGFIARTASEEDSLDKHIFVAGAHYRTGRLEARLERYKEAEAAYLQAWELLKDARFAKSPDVKKLSADVELYTGILFLQQGKPDTELWLERAQTNLLALVQEDPKPDYRFRLAQARDRLGVLFMQQRRFADAESLFWQSLQARQQLASEDPKNPEYRFRVAQSYRQLAGVDFALGKKPEGLKAANEARRIQEQLLDDNKTSTVYLALLAAIETLLAEQHTPRMRTQKEPLAVLHARNAAKTWGKMVALNPGDSKFQRAQAEANANLARQCQHQKLPLDARESIKLAIEILKELQVEEPNNLLTERLLLQTLTVRTNILRDFEDKAVVAAAEEALTAAESLMKSASTDRVVQALTAEAWIGRARVRMDAKQLKEAKADLDASWPHLAAGEDARVTKMYAQSMADWMDESEDYAELVKVATAIAGLKLPPGQAHFEAACFYGRTGSQVAKSTYLTEEERAKMVRGLSDNAVHQVRLAVKAGFKDAAALETEEDLDLPRPTNEMREIIASLQPAAPKPRDN